ncbi:MAG: hypothetical protein IPJ39_21935 [Saprospiraceae bacterium]|nr:hypothetical protein [Saprospiraceae bacterium]
MYWDCKEIVWIIFYKKNWQTSQNCRNLLKEFGSVENIIANADKLKGKQKENVINFADQAFIVEGLATIDINSPIQFDAEKFNSIR